MRKEFEGGHKFETRRGLVYGEKFLIGSNSPNTKLIKYRNEREIQDKKGL